MKRLSLLLLCLGLVGCATTNNLNLNSISLGLTKSDVVKNLGNPASVSAQANTEYLKYYGGPCISKHYINSIPICDEYTEYFVRLVNSKVESYGKVGDFNSTKNPTNDINLNIKSESK